MSGPVWNVAFLPAGRPRHCLAFAPMGDGWIVINPCWRRTSVKHMTPARFDRWIRAVAPRACVLRMAAGNDAPPWWPGLLCVGQVRQLLGLRSGALFPGGLRRDMLRAGAKQVFTR